jgi:uncharacterized protein YcbX
MRVARLWRYPVKSLAGECLDALEFDARGVVGDRLYAVAAADGRFGSGKTTRRFGRIDGLLELGASQSGAIPEIELPDGRRFAVDDPAAAAALAERLGQPVRLVREGQVPHMDAGPVHLLTTASLAALARALPGGAVVAERFRPNLLLDGPGDEPGAGATLQIGERVRLRVVEPTERCRMVDLAQRGLPAAGPILRHLAQHAGACFGVYAEVVVPGAIRCGDPVVCVERGPAPARADTEAGRATSGGGSIGHRRGDR